MASDLYDIITVGGGLGGATVAKVMAERGARVLVLERERQFRDRVRGEILSSWGVAELRTLGLYELLRDGCGHELPLFDTSLGPGHLEHRDLVATTPMQAPGLSFYHPRMQEVLLAAATAAGAEVRRGTSVHEVRPGVLPTVVVAQDGHSEEVRARLVVGADGRTSMTRRWGGFETEQDPPRLVMAGVLFEEMQGVPDNASYWLLNPSLGQAVPLFPQGQGRVRAYFTYQATAQHRLQGEQDVPRLIEESVKTGAAAALYEGARAVGPLATFDGADRWVPHPYRMGVALIGDAAAASDHSFGQGMSLTLRDVRVLRDHLLRLEDWNVAGHAYADDHDRYYGVVHTVTRWFTQLLLETGPEAEARRARALPLITQDATRIPDVLFSGPEVPVNETVRRRFFGEE
jgi:2-polyprenyl-6-methoxyphenol hydroxylase-like FAD-dependent oxidoreductase